MPYYADVIIPINVNQLLTYALPDDFVEICKIGTRAAVPLGKKNLYTAVVVKVHQNKPIHYEVKPIKEILDPFPIVNIFQLKLMKWIKSYYLASYNDIIKACLPSALLIKSETLIQLNETEDFSLDELSDDEYLVVEAIKKQQELRLLDIQKILNKTSSLKVINSLIDKNIIQIDRQVKHIYTPKLKTYLKIDEVYNNEQAFNSLIEDLNRAIKQKEVLFEYFKLKAQSQKPISRTDLVKRADTSDSVVKALIDKAIFIEYNVKEDRIKLVSKNEDNTIKLSDPQTKALEKIKTSFIEKDVTLFKGVTSSGKTEIYLKLIEDYLALNGQILYLLPEIALTVQLIKRIQEKFGKKVLVYHSKYSANERVEVYKKVLHHNEAQIIVGTRSAVFLPFSNVNLIIVDESHENSYKQHDPSPRYHARDTAIILAKIHAAKVLLGTATPSFETYHNVQQKKYALVELNERYADVKPPNIIVLDLKDAHKRKKLKGHFTLELIEKIKHTLDLGKQVIIFQNRRGFSPVVECLTCGHTPQCPNCDVSLTMHKSNNTLRCHYCGYKMAIQKRCITCGSLELRLSGFGTEQIEEEAKSLFPQANIKRMDLDTTRGKYDFEKIINSFENLETDILIGTQMLTKGLDFRNVHLVAVMHADGLLYFPNFRAFEKTYQLFVQVSGRAGRTKEQGEVVIQTFSPTHPVINYVVKEDYEGFYNTEIEQRISFNYPPHYKLIKLIFKAKDYNRLNEAAEWMGLYLKQIFKDNVLGPEFPSVARIRNQYIKQILLKIPPKQSLSKTKSYLEKGIVHYENIGKFKSVRLNIDVDTYN